MTQTTLALGIDTGGTFTDAVLHHAERGVIAKAKALTTRHDLSVGIAGAVRAVLADHPDAAAAIGFVALSTTLATNALVEGQGAPAALVMIGFSPDDARRGGLDAALGSSPVIHCDGGHDGHGREQPLDLAPLAAFLHSGAAVGVRGLAVASVFAVRNPAHELAARALIRQMTGKPVTLSHELSAKLNGPKRALTTLLNARLVPMISGLMDAVENTLAAHAIGAPLMVVRGDGSLVTASFARERPVETILSGPAASVLGARALTGMDRALVSDIGGTTTDVAVLESGLPRIDPEGAMVGGHRTMVEAVAMRTFGLGGDSEVHFDERALTPALALGPRRLVPVALLAHEHEAHVVPVLERQLAQPLPPRHAGRFARLVMTPDLAVPFGPAAERIANDLAPGPLPLETLARNGQALAALERLVAAGVVQMAGFTPSDAAHAVGVQSIWNRNAALAAAELMARRRTGRGQPLAPDGDVMARHVLALVTRRTAEAILETAFAEDGLEGPAMVATPLVQRAIDGIDGIATIAIAPDRPVIGLGASAGLHYARLPERLGVEVECPVHADVANALGAVVGTVRVSASVMVTAPAADHFRVSAGPDISDHRERDAALSAARRAAEALALQQAVAAGADAPDITLTEHVTEVPVDNLTMFVEASITATATGRPRTARAS
ncbi:MAG: hydantoinase/oxoprolinase family protein [Rhizobiaceae bacterium]|nr:hydantoinase/oxoprolinase family protein [Rhizobiaceae bacterium]